MNYIKKIRLLNFVGILLLIMLFILFGFLIKTWVSVLKNDELQKTKSKIQIEFYELKIKKLKEGD